MGSNILLVPWLQLGHSQPGHSTRRLEQMNRATCWLEVPGPGIKVSGQRGVWTNLDKDKLQEALVSFH